jgi:predicted amidophosphoribosyltransferase
MLGAKLKQTRFATVDAVLPVPLHPNRLKSRGYNQSEWIAKGIAESLQKEVWTDVLRREVENVSQTKKDSFQRWKNVEGIFSLSDVRSLDGLHLLVVDDVLTTGATLEASILPLKSEKNVRVSVAVLAVVGL